MRLRGALALSTLSTVSAYWAVTTGSDTCTIKDSAGYTCVQDNSGYYESNSDCTFSWKGQHGLLRREEWGLEASSTCGFDYLEVNGVYYCGSTAYTKSFPSSIPMSELISYNCNIELSGSAQSSVNRMGVYTAVGRFAGRPTYRLGAAVTGSYYLWFHSLNGMWYVGETIGGSSAVIRVEDSAVIPSGVTSNWQVWVDYRWQTDTGLKASSKNCTISETAEFTFHSDEVYQGIGFKLCMPLNDAPLTPAPELGWTITSGSDDCAIVDGGLCVQDTAGNYEAYDRCEFSWNGGPGLLERKEWGLEASSDCSYDWLKVNGFVYCGSTSYKNSFPSHLSLSGPTAFKFQSDLDTQSTGFKFCMKTTSTPAPTPASTPAPTLAPGWTITSGDGCAIVDGGFCVQDTAAAGGFPEISCRFTYSGEPVALQRVKWGLKNSIACQTADALQVNSYLRSGQFWSVKYCGSNSGSKSFPSTLYVTGTTTFYFTFTMFPHPSTGFKICMPVTPSPTPTPTAVPSSAPTLVPSATPTLVPTPTVTSVPTRVPTPDPTEFGFDVSPIKSSILLVLKLKKEYFYWYKNTGKNLKIERVARDRLAMEIGSAAKSLNMEVTAEMPKQTTVTLANKLGYAKLMNQTMAAYKQHPAVKDASLWWRYCDDSCGPTTQQGYDVTIPGLWGKDGVCDSPIAGKGAGSNVCPPGRDCSDCGPVFVELKKCDFHTQCTKVEASEVLDSKVWNLHQPFGTYYDYDMTLDELEEMINTPLKRNCDEGVCVHTLEKPPSKAVSDVWEDIKCNAKEGAADGINGAKGAIVKKAKQATAAGKITARGAKVGAKFVAKALAKGAVKGGAASLAWFGMTWAFSVATGKQIPDPIDYVSSLFGFGSSDDGCGGGGGGCFSDLTHVELVDGTSISMSRLRVGDKVRVVSPQTGLASYREVFMWGKRRTETRASYHTLHVMSSGSHVQATKEHFIPILRSGSSNGHVTVRMDQVKIGDNVYISRASENTRSTGSWQPVTNITVSTFQGGLYVPLLRGSDVIVVDGVAVSMYADLGSSVLNWGAKAALQVAQLVYRTTCWPEFHYNWLYAGLAKIVGAGALVDTNTESCMPQAP